VGGRAPDAARVTRRFGVAPAMAADLLGVLTLALAAAYVRLARLARDFSEGWQVVLAVVAALPGVLVARRQPGNPIGWILICPVVCATFYADVARYAMLDYRFHHGDLPLGPAAVLVAAGLWTSQFLVLPLVILLFPDGHRLPQRWKRMLRAYLVVATVVAVYTWAAMRRRWPTDRSRLTRSASWSASTSRQACSWPVAIAVAATLPVFWAAFVARQILSWRRAFGERRYQLKWQMSGAAVSVAGLAGIFGFGQLGDPVVVIVGPILLTVSTALLIAMSVAILKCRLYDIDRIISRMAYTIVTGLLVGVYTGLVLLATGVFRFHSTVAVAAATLATAALFTPAAAACTAGNGTAVQPGQVQRRPGRDGVRSPAERLGGPGLGPRRPSPGGIPRPGTRAPVSMDQPPRLRLVPAGPLRRRKARPGAEPNRLPPSNGSGHDGPKSRSAATVTDPPRPPLDAAAPTRPQPDCQESRRTKIIYRGRAHVTALLAESSQWPRRAAPHLDNHQDYGNVLHLSAADLYSRKVVYIFRRPNLQMTGQIGRRRGLSLGHMRGQKP
jgi:hypothetical protein